MDSHKRQTLIKWFDALCPEPVNSFNDLRDGAIIVALLMSEGDNFISKDADLTSPQKRLLALKSYIEGFYHQSFDDGQLIDFRSLIQQNGSGDVFDMEMGKLLLALVGCLVQDICREKFLAPAMDMDQRSQYEIKEMIEPIILKEVDYLPLDFGDVLKRKTDTCAHVDAALFLKLVAGNNDRVMSSPRPATPQQPSNAPPVYSMYSNSPVAGNTSCINIRDISSPLRVMSISSPVTPLGALMHSPQLAQKIMTREQDKRHEAEMLLRQKAQECKRLEVTLQNEQHLRSELELDLREKSAKLEEKDCKLRDLERQSGETRKLRDRLDELELLRAEKDKQDRDLNKLQGRLTEFHDLKEHNVVIERENQESLDELQKAREEIKLLDSMKKISEEYRVKCHKQQLELCDLEGSLQHRSHEIEQLHVQMEECRNMYSVAMATNRTLKQEKEELEEMIGSNNAMMGGASFVGGESMSIVTEKRMSELQGEYDQLRASWIEPSVHQSVCKQLEMETDTRKTYEERFVEYKKQLMCSQDEVDKLNNTVSQYQSNITALDTSLEVSQRSCDELQGQVTSLQVTVDGLVKSEAELLRIKEQFGLTIQGLEKELAQSKTEVQLTRGELEAHMETNENRRATILQMDNEKLEQHRTEQRLSVELHSWKSKMEVVKGQLTCVKEEAQNMEETLTSKVQALQSSLSHTEGELDSCKIEHENLVTGLKQKVENLEADLKDGDVTLESERKVLNDKIDELEMRVKSEQDISKERLGNLKAITEELNKFKSTANEKQESLSSELSETVKAKKALDMELHRLKLEFQTATESYNTKYQKLESKRQDKESSLKIEIEKLKTAGFENVQVQKSLREELTSLQQSIQKYKFEMEKLTKIIEQYKCGNSDLGDSLDSTKMKLVEYEYQLKTLNGKYMTDQEQSTLILNQRQEVNDKLQQELDTLMNTYSQEKSHLENKIKELDSTVSENEAQFKAKQESLETKLSDTKQDYKNQIQSINQQKIKAVEALNSEINDLKLSTNTTVKSLQEKLTVLEQEVSDKESMRFELECSDKEKALRLDTLMKELDFFKQSEKNLKLVLSELNDDYGALKNVIKERDEGFEEFRNIISVKDDKVIGLENQLSEASETIKTLQKENQNDKDQFKQSKMSYSEELDSVRNQMETTEAEALKLKTELKQTITDLESSVLVATHKVKELEEQTELLTNENHSSTLKYTSELDTLKEQQQRNVNTLELSEQAKQELESQVKSLEQSCCELKTELETCRSTANKEKRELTGQIRHLDECQANLGDQLQVTKAAMEASKSEIEQQMSVLSTEKNHLSNRLDESMARTVALETETVELKDKLVDTESYWRSQCEQLEEEYASGTQEQKETLKQQLEEMEEQYEGQIRLLSEDKDVFLATQTQAWQDRVTGLEKALLDRKAEMTEYVQQLTDRLTVQGEQYKQTVEQREELSVKVVEIEENKKKEIEMLIGQYETQLVELRQELTSQGEVAVLAVKSEHEAVVKRLTEDCETRMASLQTEVDEQRLTYQQMISDMEGRLGGETTGLRERLSQMKCQYETLIESKEKDTKTKVKEFEEKLKSLEELNSNLEQELKLSNEQVSQLEEELAVLIAKNTEYEGLMSQAKHVQTELENKVSTGLESVAVLETELASAKMELCSVKVELVGLGEESKKVVGERAELQRQLAYTQDRNDTLTAELSSQQQQLAAVEEEKRVLETEISRIGEEHRSSMEDVRQGKEKDVRFVELEKMELERQLQSSQKCYEAVQRSETELERQISKMADERSQLETRNRELEQRIYNYLEREKKMTEDNQHQIDKAAELNGTLRRQLDEKCSEMTQINDRFSQEMDVTKQQLIEMTTRYETNLRTLTEEKTALEAEAGEGKQLQVKLSLSESECQRLQDINDKYNIHYNKKKEIIVQLQTQLTSVQHELDNYKKIEERLIKEVNPLREKLDAEIIKNKQIGAKLRTYEAQNDLMERKLRDYKNQLDKKDTVFLGDGSHFQQLISSRENAADASFMENHPPALSLNESVFSSEDQTCIGQTDNTLTPGTRSSRSRKRMSKSLSAVSNDLQPNGQNADTVSIGSASSLAYRLRSRESAVSLNRSILSVDSCKSNASVPRGTGGLYHCEDEPMDFEFGRLGELQRRNTMCPAHLKTAYPVETQIYKPNKFRDDALRESTMGNVTLQGTQLTGSGRKRKLGDTESGSDSSDSKSKLAKQQTGCVYQKPGPPTPANSRRNSGKGTSKSPSSRRTSKGSKSPRTPASLRGRRTPKRTPKNTPKKSTHVDRENPGSGKKSNKRDSVSYSIGFSPLSLGRSNRLTRQQGFVQKQPSSSQTAPVTRKPLGTRNYLQTGL